MKKFMLSCAGALTAATLLLSVQPLALAADKPASGQSEKKAAVRRNNVALPKAIGKGKTTVLKTLERPLNGPGPQDTTKVDGGAQLDSSGATPAAPPSR